MATSRRGFMQVAGGATAASLAACKLLEGGYPEEYSVEKPAVPGAKGWSPGEERFIKSACLQCQGGCGIVVRVVEGRAVKIDGNKAYPTNRGGLCPKGQNGLQVLYDPDRIKGPLARKGERGSGRWERISWDEAIATVADRLGTLRKNGESHATAFLGGRYRGHMREHVRRFMTAYGSPNEIDNGSSCGAGEAAHQAMQGIRDRLAYDWERTRYVLVFGAGFIESFVPTAMMLRVYAHLRQGVAGQRAKIVQIEPRRGVSAAKADEWVCVRPGTDAALALGMAHVLIRDGLVDERFLRERAAGFESWSDASGTHMGFKELVLKQYAPAAVSGISGIAEKTIERLAREFGTHRPALAIAGRGVAAHTNGLYSAMAVHALNALVGSIDVPGGAMVQRHPPFAKMPAPELDDVATRGLEKPRFDLGGVTAPMLATSDISALAERIETRTPYPLKAAFFYYTNPLFSLADPQRFKDALAKVPLLVSFSPFLDETTMQCDLVLPDHTYLERWQIDEVSPSVGHALFSVRQPVVAPLHDTRSTGEVIIQIAKSLGGTVARSFPASELDLIKDVVKGVQESGRGSVQSEDFEEFWTKLLAAGGWWDESYEFGDWKRVLATPSGKFEFHSKYLDDQLATAARARFADASPGEGRDKLLAAIGLKARGDEACLPHYEPVATRTAAKDYPFVLNSYKTMTHAEGRGANQPHLQEVYGVQFDQCWQAWAEIHPADARPLGIGEGDDVWLTSPTGRMRVRAILHEHQCRGVVNVPFEYGHTAYGHWATRGDNVNRLIGSDREPLAGGAARYDARVAITKA